MAFGLRLVRIADQGENQGGTQEYSIDPSDTTALFTGDAVKIDGGYVTQAAAGDPVNGYFAGVRYVDTDGSFVYRNQWDGVAGRSDVKAAVAGGGGSRFYIEMDAGQGAAAQTMIGTRRNLIVNAGDTIYGDSRSTLGAVSATGTFYVEALADLPNNNLGDTSAIFEVTVSALARNA